MYNSDLEINIHCFGLINSIGVSRNACSLIFSVDEQSLDENSKRKRCGRKNISSGNEESEMDDSIDCSSESSDNESSVDIQPIIENTDVGLDNDEENE